MDFTSLRTHLVEAAARLQDAAAAAAPDAAVPTCPEWTTTDLLDHVTETYDHKIQSMRHLKAPGDDFRIPRPGTVGDQYTAALADLLTEFDQRGPESLAYTWYGPDQTVGFWIRRMAHETLIHRVDAELAAARPVSPIDPALALDGIDEMLTVMLAWGSRAYREWLAGALDGNDGLTIAIDASAGTGGRSWTVRVSDGTITTGEGIDQDAHARVSGEAGDLLLWLWRRLPAEAPQIDGDQARAAGAFYGLLADFAQ